MRQAHFWFAPGLEFNKGIDIHGDPPRTYRLPVEMPMDVLGLGEYSVVDCPAPQICEFELANGPGLDGQVIHYDRISIPPAGYRWLIARGRICAEKIRASRSSETASP